MKVIFVVDNIEDLNKKINIVKAHFGENIHYVVKGNFVPLFATFNLPIDAVYVNNLAEVVHHLLLRFDVDDIVMCYASLNINNKLFDDFLKKIADKDKIVNIMPKYNAWERMCNGAYNIYVHSIFKANDSMASPKLQFLPLPFVNELLMSHFGNKLFEIDAEHVTTLYVEDKETNKSLKVKTGFNKNNLIPIIIALLITAALVVCLAFLKFHFLIIIVFICLYLADIILSIFYRCKLYFDARFLK